VFTECSYAFYSIQLLIEMPQKKEKEKIHVLFVCRDLGLIEAEKSCLEHQGGLWIETAVSNDEALTKLERTKPDVIIGDWSSAHDNSEARALVEALRSEGDMTPIVVFAYDDEKELFAQLCRAGTVGFVGKSGDPARVYSSLKSCIVAITAHHC
jgi:DNA-binding NarL/FixJ family response regulator